MTEAYIEGFRKAAELIGVDPEALARGQVKRAGMQKRAFTLAELLIVAGLLGGGVAGIRAARGGSEVLNTRKGVGYGAGIGGGLGTLLGATGGAIHGKTVPGRIMGALQGAVRGGSGGAMTGAGIGYVAAPKRTNAG